MTNAEIVVFTGYVKISVNHWCSIGALKAFKRGIVFYVPKVYLIEFLCGNYFRTITRKSETHIKLLKEFAPHNHCEGLAL